MSIIPKSPENLCPQHYLCERADMQEAGGVLCFIEVKASTQISVLSKSLAAEVVILVSCSQSLSTRCEMMMSFITKNLTSLHLAPLLVKSSSSMPIFSPSLVFGK